MKSSITPLSISGATAGSSGLQLARMPAGSVPYQGSTASMGVTSTGDVVVVDSGFGANLLSDATIGNTTADTNVLATTLPAGGLIPGSAIQIKTFGNVKQSALLTTYNASMWVKIGTTKVITAPFSFTNNTNPFYVFTESFLTLRSTGTSASLACTFVAFVTGAATASGQVYSLATINTTVSQNLSVGFNWSTASSNITATFNQAIIDPR